VQKIKIAEGGRLLRFAAAVVAAYVGAAIISQSLSVSEPDTPWAPLYLYTAVALVVASASSICCALLSHSDIRARLIWVVSGVLLIALAGSEDLAPRAAIPNGDLVEALFWLGILANLAAAIRAEQPPNGVRTLILAAFCAQAIAALGNAGDGMTIGRSIAGPVVLDWIGESLDLVGASISALALAAAAGMMALQSLATRPTLECRAAPAADRCWLAPGFHACEVTGEEAANALDWSFIDAAYCISLREREDRTAAATATFNTVGLAHKLVFYRPERHPTDTVLGIWNSHCAVARQALAAGHRRAAIFEDDVCFDRGISPGKLAAIGLAMDRLPADWQIFFLGHWPVSCRFVSPTVLRTQSGCGHAYIANHALLEWMASADHAQYRRAHPAASVVGLGIDDAFYRLRGAYAIFPMVAIQSDSPSDHIKSKRHGKIASLRHVVTRTRLREWALSRLMRPNELRAVAIATLRWLFRLS